MKMLPIPLSLNGPPLGLWGDMLWRYPAPPSPLADLKTQLPPQLPSDPRLWGREDVTVFLRFCEHEFDLPKFELDLFQMNGKALCLLNRSDFGERCPGAGDVLHNVLQMLIRESQMVHRYLPNSPVTPTSRYSLSPHSHPPTPNWASLAPPESPFHNVSHYEKQQQQQQQQQQQKQHQQQNGNQINHSNQMNGNPTASLSSNPTASLSSNPSDSDEDNYSENASAMPTQTSNNIHQQQIQSQQMYLKQPVAPTSRYPLSPHSHPPTPNWASLAPPESPFHNVSHYEKQQQQQQQQQHQQQNGNQTNGNQMNGNPTTSSTSNPSDSDEDNKSENPNAMPTQTSNNIHQLQIQSQQQMYLKQQQQQQQQQQQHQQQQQLQNTSPPPTPSLKDLKPSLSQQITNVMNSWNTQQRQQQHQNVIKNESVSAPTTPSYNMPVKREFFPDTPEPNTNGRLLWDFLQQLLNDPAQRYSSYIAWKCRDTGVFKIVDPAGLAKLWGIQKNHLSMNYDKMSRALRYYYRVNILRKVQGERHCYQFLRNPSELKNIKNISLLRQTVTNNSAQQSNSSQQSNLTNSKNGQQNNHKQQQQQQQSSAPQSPTCHHYQPQQNGNNNGNQHLGLPPPLALSQISSSSNYSNGGPPPTSPHILHAIHGAFFNLAAAAGINQPPQSPLLPPTPSEKLQFSSLKIESNSNDGIGVNDEPTDLTVGEKRSYNDQQIDCYPLIRNSDGLTTIKLIRYNNSNESNNVSNSETPSSTITSTTPNKHEPDVLMTAVDNSDSNTNNNDESEDINVDDSLMPTDLSK